MDSRLYFILGDLVSNLLVGAIAGWLAALVIVTGWHMIPAMFLAMAVGMLVDGAIVVTEMADRRMAEGETRHDAYSRAAIRMSWPIIASAPLASFDSSR